MGSPKHDERGLVGVVLTIVIVWALIAVVMLTRTLVAAQSIDTTVVGIKASVNGANSHLNTGCDPTTNTNCTSDALPALNTTAAVAAQIDTEAKPLSMQAGEALNDLNSINSTVTAILATASSIHTTVQSIHGLAGSIGGSVNSINSSLSGVNADVIAVQSQVVGINNRAQTAIDVVAAIKGDTSAITGEAGGILVQAQGICADQPVKLLGLNILTGLAGKNVCTP